MRNYLVLFYAIYYKPVPYTLNERNPDANINDIFKLVTIKLNGWHSTIHYTNLQLSEVKYTVNIPEFSDLLKYTSTEWNSDIQFYLKTQQYN